MRRFLVLSFVFGYVVFFARGPILAVGDTTEAIKEKQEVEGTIARFKEKDPSMERFFDNSYGYAVFPEVAKAAFIAGFTEGEGLVYEKGEVVGRVTLNQATIGLQAGAQGYSEIIFFENKAAFDSLKSNDLKLSKQVSAVVVTAGASAQAGYTEGVAVFTMSKGGLMLEASIGGQQFKFEPVPQ
ncbi:MAG: lipid-binding SYLF domain-containing protein [Deltaproteobacteria bacterium]|nr:MAG: lipid-binding SYLF domain-containing protein [Deltaproteobacteria bacterium]